MMDGIKGLMLYVCRKLYIYYNPVCRQIEPKGNQEYSISSAKTEPQQKNLLLKALKWLIFPLEKWEVIFFLFICHRRSCISIFKLLPEIYVFWDRAPPQQLIPRFSMLGKGAISPTSHEFQLQEINIIHLVVFSEMCTSPPIVLSTDKAKVLKINSLRYLSKFYNYYVKNWDFFLQDQVPCFCALLLLLCDLQSFHQLCVF